MLCALPARGPWPAAAACTLPSRSSSRHSRALQAAAVRPGGSGGGGGQPGGATASSVRINKAFREFASRREADRFVAEGRVTVNGQTAAPGQQVSPGDVVALDGRPVRWEALQAELVAGAGSAAAAESGKASQPAAAGGSGQQQRQRLVARRSTPAAARHDSSSDGDDEDGAPLPLESSFLYLKYWKPRGVTCTTDARVRGNVASQVRHPSGARLFPVGRLDKESTGLLLLTSDGRLPNAALRHRAGQPKLYRVTADRPVHPADVEQLAAGVVITTVAQRDSGPGKPLTAPTLPCRVRADLGDPSGCTLLVELKEGRNRQIRRMLEALGYETRALHRVGFLGLGLAGLREGQWRELGEPEMRVVRRVVRAAAAASAAGADTEQE